MEQEIKVGDKVIYTPPMKMLPAGAVGVVAQIFSNKAIIKYAQYIGTGNVTSHSAPLTDLTPSHP